MSRIDVGSVVHLLHCPVCKGELSPAKESLVCSCGNSYLVKDGCVSFTEKPNGYEEDGEGANVPSSSWGPWRRHNFTYFKEALADVPDSASVLDLGAGPGQFSALTERFSPFISLDFRAFKPTNVIADLTKPLPIKDASLDVVMASNVLEHIPDTSTLLTEVHRVLKPGGTFIATIPFLMRVHQKPYDFNRYTNFQLENLLHSSGFQNVNVCALSSPLDVYRSIERHFYTLVIKDCQGITRAVLKLLYFVSRARISLLGQLSVHTPLQDFTEGYGLMAQKP